MNIWLHQAVKSRGAQGTSNPNFYLSILFRRICKLLFFGIRPVFVFDGAVPDLKKATLAVRRASRRNLQTKSDLARRRLLNRILRRMAKAETDRKSTKDACGTVHAVTSALLVPRHYRSVSRTPSATEKR
ncbi:hypothetical protein AAHC03_026267 [Spirometra sp. Aus1]